MPLEAIIGLASALVALLTALVTLIVKVQRVHVLVNKRMTEAVDRIEQLTRALTAAGTDVPDTPDRGRHEH